MYSARQCPKLVACVAVPQRFDSKTSQLSPTGNHINSCWKSEAEKAQEAFVNQAGDVSDQLGASAETKDAVTRFL